MQPLREVWMMIGIEKVNTHEGVMVKVLLDSGATGMFVDKKFVERQGFKLEKLNRPSRVTNVDGSHNSGGLIMHEKEDWGREEEMEIDHQKIKTMVPKWFHQWLKVLGKVESERMPVRKI